jgi:23S rRNA (guanosine2251-2'-O)-methyltransferase
MAEAAPIDYADLDEVLARVPAGRDPFLVALDQVQDPHNLGAIIRTAAAAGADAVIIPERRAASLGLGALKAAAGAAEWFPVVRVVNLARAIDQLKERGIWAVGAEGGAPQLCWQADLVRPLLLVVGGEDRGLGRLIRDKCDYLVRLPMHANVQSLNASVAAGVLIYEVTRQREHNT